MIEIIRDQQKVVLKFTIYVPLVGTQVYAFPWDCKVEEYAGLLAARMRMELETRLRAIREKAYREGYRDGRSKVAKAKFFSGRMED